MSTLEIRDHIYSTSPEGVQIWPNANYFIKRIIFPIWLLKIVPQSKHQLLQEDRSPSVSYFSLGVGPASFSFTTLRDSEVRGKILNQIITHIGTITSSPPFPSNFVTKGSCHKSRQRRPQNPLNSPVWEMLFFLSLQCVSVLHMYISISMYVQEFYRNVSLIA